MKKGEIYDGVIDKVVFPNKGIIFVGDGQKWHSGAENPFPDQ